MSRGQLAAVAVGTLAFAAEATCLGCTSLCFGPLELAGSVWADVAGVYR